MSSSRVINTKRNIIWSFIEYLILILFSFISNAVIVHYLGVDYLGLSGLFTSILQVLNVAELGFSVAVTYNMYKPIAENDTVTVNALLAFYRKIYFAIGSLVFVVGIIVMPFIPYLIEGGYPESINIYVLYFLYLSNTAVSYFLFSYRTALLNALQRLDLTKLAYCIVSIVQNVLQILSISVFQNYYLFVGISIAGTAFKNIISAYISHKKFPVYKCSGDLEPAIKSNIASKVKGLLICNISGVTYTTFDSIILSALKGLFIVAVYNNYLLVFNGISHVISMIRYAMQASVGNSVDSESVEKNHNDLKKWQFLFSMIATFCSACLVCVYQPFMKLWMGEKMLLPFIDVVLLSVLFFISTVQHAHYLYLNAAGLWLEMKWAYISSTILNIVLNLLLCHLLSTTGIILATLIASLLSGLVWQTVVVFREYFKRSASSYLIKQMLYFVFAAVLVTVSYMLTTIIGLDGIVGIIVNILVCFGISALSVIVIFGRTEEYRACLNIFKALFRKKQ